MRQSGDEYIQAPPIPARHHQLLRLALLSFQPERYGESDYGISRYVADNLPVPESGEFLRGAYAHESSEDGVREFQRLAANNPTHFKQPNDLEWLGFFERPNAFWKQYRFGVFELARCLRVTRTRIAEGVPPKTPYRFPWLADYPQDFEEDC